MTRETSVRAGTPPVAAGRGLRLIPPVDGLLASPAFASLFDAYPREEIVREVRGALDDLRSAARQGDISEPDLSPEGLRSAVEARLIERFSRYYRKVINATGVILHTGLGRAALADEAVRALAELAGGAQRLEIDLESGERGGRDAGCARHLVALTGAEAATVVNNNAAATLLILAALARGKKVLLSRGEMVEIGGSYRVPEVMRESGAILHGVGTTNRTHERDYRQAIDADVGLILKVHTSNYRVVGFTKEVDVAALVGLGREHGIPVVHDLGSGCLVDLGARRIPPDQMVQASVAAGADVVCFSGDKLLGGPQAGILVGRRQAVEACRSHQLFRALRPGRLIYTALEATLRLYLEGIDRAIESIPTLRRLTATEEELRGRAERLRERLADLPGLEVEVVPCPSQAGSGSLPARDLPSWGVRLRSLQRSAADLAAELRTGEPSILVRVQEEGLLFDARTLTEEDLEPLRSRLASAVT